MPLPITLAHRLAAAAGRGAQGRVAAPTSGPTARRRSRSSTSSASPWRCATVVIAAQHDDEVSDTTGLRDDMIEMVIKPVIPAELRTVEPDDTTSTRPAASSSAARWATPA